MIKWVRKRLIMKCWWVSLVWIRQNGDRMRTDGGGMGRCNGVWVVGRKHDMMNTVGRRHDRVRVSEWRGVIRTW